MITFLTKTRLTFIALFLVLALIIPLSDPDYFWHLKTGEYIVSRHALPSGDIFSFTRFGQPWILHEWLFEVVLYAVFASMGPLGVKLLTSLLAVTTLGVIFTLVRRITQSPAAAFILLAAALIPFAGAIAPRPQLVTFVAFAIFVHILLSHKYYRANRYLWLLPVLMVVWVNAHGGYIVGIALTGMFTVCEWFNYWKTKTRDLEQKQRLVQLTRVACATALASVLNPGSIDHWLYPFQVLNMAANGRIQEWQSPNFHEAGPEIYLLLVLFLMLVYTYAEPKADITELLVPGLFAASGFNAARHVPLAVLGLVPFIALALSRGCIASCSAKWRGSKLQRMYASGVSSRELGQIEFALNWIVLAALSLSLSLIEPNLHAKEIERTKQILPVGAANFLMSKGIHGNIFNSYNHGGYLIYRLSPDSKVFIDGRVDVYGDKIFLDFLDIYEGKSIWKEKFDKLSIDYAIVDKDAPIRQLLLMSTDFREIYLDHYHSVLMRSAPRRPVLLSDSGH